MPEEWGEWSETVTFSTSAAVGDGYAYLYASDVDTAVPVPHIWWMEYDDDTITIVGHGFGEDASEYDGEIWVTYEPGGDVELTPDTWTLTAATGDADTANREIVYTGASDPEHIVITADAPDDIDDRGVGVHVGTDGGGGGGGGDSDTVYGYPVDAPAPQSNTGWWVEVALASDPETVFSQIHNFKELTFTRALNDTGFGELWLDKEDPFLDIMLDPEEGDETEGRAVLYFDLYFHFVHDGARRFTMLYDGKNKDRSQSDKPEEVQITGTGRAVELSWGIVLPNNWPANIKSRPRKRENQVWANLFIDVFREAKDRGEIPPDLTLGFTATHDSYGRRWNLELGESDREVEIGTNLLDLISSWADVEEFDWTVTPRGRVLAAPVLGQDLSNEIRFFNAATNNEVGAAEDRKDLRNVVYVEGTNGHISVAEGELSIARWRRRATYLRSDEARSERQRLRVARGTLRQIRRPNRERSVVVPYEHLDVQTGESYGRTVFKDYGPGDTVGFGPYVDALSGVPLDSRNVRIPEIGIRVNSEGIDVELMVETRIERFQERARRLLQARLGAWTSAKTARQGKPPVGNMRDTDTDGVRRGDSLVYNNDSQLWKAGRPTDVWPFWYNATLVETDSKMYLPVDADRTIIRVTAELGDPSSAGQVRLRLKRNNVGVHTMTINAGDRRKREDVNIPVTPDDKLSVDILDPGTGAGFLQFTVEAGM